ncbi:MAG: LysR family transcriptional regulator, partial [Lachnospiraceae bacterium]|nr:LysR family transcriptional regulator [Lachnospiraceae bacterium]
MEFRVLQYFLAVAREETISGAAESLHITQPTLSRQMKELEDELGKQLFIRGNRKITLTEDGMLLRHRAEE